jgi:hypothetical protein
MVIDAIMIIVKTLQRGNVQFNLLQMTGQLINPLFNTQNLLSYVSFTNSK